MLPRFDRNFAFFLKGAEILFLSLLPHLTFAADCPVTRIEVRSQNSTYYGSAFPLKINGRKVFITADHVIPFDLTQDDLSLNRITVQASQAGGAPVPVTILRRDWASDLMILSADSAEIRECSPDRKAPAAGASVKLIGFPGESTDLVQREGTLSDPAAHEVRLARPFRMIKAIGNAENGMSGGALVNVSGGVMGILLQDWVMPNHPEQGGIYALATEDLITQASTMLSHAQFEMPAPFEIRRAIPELSAFGFRFRPGLPEEVTGLQYSRMLRYSRIGGGGGHPDGIGGQDSGDQLEIVGLSGEAVPLAWQPMERILRRVQSEGGSEMLVRSTASGLPCQNLVELARLILESPDSPPDLAFFLNRTSRLNPGDSKEDLDSLSEEMVVLALSLAESNPSTTEYAQTIRKLQGDWARTHEIRAIQEMVKTGKAASSVWANSRQSDNRYWKTIVEFQVVILRIEKNLGN